MPFLYRLFEEDFENGFNGIALALREKAKKSRFYPGRKLFRC